MVARKGEYEQGKERPDEGTETVGDHVPERGLPARQEQPLGSFDAGGQDGSPGGREQPQPTGDDESQEETDRNEDRNVGCGLNVTEPDSRQNIALVQPCHQGRVDGGDPDAAEIHACERCEKQQVNGKAGEGDASPPTRDAGTGFPQFRHFQALLRHVFPQPTSDPDRPSLMSGYERTHRGSIVLGENGCITSTQHPNGAHGGKSREVACVVHPDTSGAYSSGLAVERSELRGRKYSLMTVTVAES